MQKYLSRVLLACASLLVLCLVLFLPALPWSTRCRHAAHKLYVRTEMRLARWHGNLPRLASVTGSLTTRGIQIEVLDSRSGWATLADSQGRFLLLDVMWYPGARYDLIFAQDAETARHISVRAPDRLPENGLIDIGNVSLDETCELSGTDLPGLNSITYLDYDSGNTEYYRRVFQRQVAETESDEEKIDALTGFVATKLNYEEGAGDFESARRTLERGSRYCGCLSIALAAIAEAGNYQARVIDLCDGHTHPSNHSVVEVYFEGGWHLYDPYFGVWFKGKDGRVANYREVRLNTDLLATLGPETHIPHLPDEVMDWMRDIYSSGIHHFYFFKKTRASCTLWWPFRNREAYQARITSSMEPQSIPSPAADLDGNQQEARPKKKQDVKICEHCEVRAHYALKSPIKMGYTQATLRPDQR